MLSQIVILCAFVLVFNSLIYADFHSNMILLNLQCLLLEIIYVLILCSHAMFY